MVLNCIRDNFHEEDFGHELQQTSSFYRNDLDEFKLVAKLKILTYIVDENKLEQNIQ